MLGILKSYFQRKADKKNLHSFRDEAKANLEAYYVMFQINRQRFFALQSWENVKDLVWPLPVGEYIDRLVTYNKVLQDYKDYEAWYNEDLDRKNQENGRALHQKKELVQEKFHGLENVIKAAVAAIEEKC